MRVREDRVNIDADEKGSFPFITPRSWGERICGYSRLTIPSKFRQFA